MSTIVYTNDGKKLTLTTTLGKGGEGAVYNVLEAKDIAVKIYNENKAIEREQKIKTMVSLGFSKSARAVAFPINTVQSSNGRFLGFTMKKVAGFKNIHDLYGPGSRKTKFPNADFRFLVRTAINLAGAVANVHSSGCVIGDINHSGILVSNRALVTLIDCDSFQFRNEMQIFRCQVGVPEYTPAELQGQSFKTTNRTTNHDNFGLAVLLFQLLFLGRHPYSGVFRGTGDMGIMKAICEHRYAYSVRRAETLMGPPPFAPLPSDFGNDIQATFEAAFSRAGEQIFKRPFASEWVEKLTKLEKNLGSCKTNKSHHYHKSVVHCPWCKIEKAVGHPLFTLHYTASTSTTVDIGQLLDQINAMQTPPRPPDIETLLPISLKLNPSREGIAARAERSKNFSFSVAFLIFAVVSFLGTYKSSLQFSAFFALPFGLFSLTWFAKGLDVLSETFSFKYKLIKGEWDIQKFDWSINAGPRKFDVKRKYYLELASLYMSLPRKEKEEILKLENNKRGLQLQKHLDSYLIENARILFIGRAEKIILASYGIETAWDVLRFGVHGVRGIDPLLANKLTAWEHEVSLKFVFKPWLPVDPQAIQKVKNDFQKQRSDIETELKNAPQVLQQLQVEITTLSQKLPRNLMQIYLDLKQIEVDMGLNK